jgi:hypothetical protein
MRPQQIRQHRITMASGWPSIRHGGGQIGRGTSLRGCGTPTAHDGNEAWKIRSNKAHIRASYWYTKYDLRAPLEFSRQEASVVDMITTDATGGSTREVRVSER